MNQVVVVGSINADLVFRVAAHPLPGETILGQSMLVLPGGKGANQAVAAARLGSQVAMVGAVGNDAFAPTATASLAECGVDLSAVDVVPGATGIAAITLAADGENSIVVVPGANDAVDAARVAAHADLIAKAPVVVIQGEIPVAAIEAAITAAQGNAAPRASAAPVAAAPAVAAAAPDTTDRPSPRIVLNLAPVVPVSPDSLKRANPLVVNEHEALGALEILHHSAKTTDHDEIARALVAAGVPSVVVTLGGAGALVADQDGVTPITAPKVKVVDTTGAGDAFVGALAHRLAAGDGLVEAAQYAARVGAYAVTGLGTQASYPGPTDILPS